MNRRFRPYRLVSLLPVLLIVLVTVVGGWLNGVDMNGHVVDDFSTQYPVTWHGDVAHHAADPDGEKQNINAAAHQLTFEKVFLDLCSKLDIDDGSGTGKTYLDNSLVVWTQESGEYTHAGQGMPIISAGSAAGQIRPRWSSQRHKNGRCGQ